MNDIASQHLQAAGGIQAGALTGANAGTGVPPSISKSMNTSTSNSTTTCTSRRKFLKALALTTGTVALPFSIRASDKSGCRRPVLGCGEHQYEVIHDWGQLPNGCRLGNTHGVTVDSHGRIFVKHTVGKGSTCEDAVLVFDAEGGFITSWGREFKGGAHGLHLSREGNQEFLYLCDPNRGLVVKTTLDGYEVWRRTYTDCGDSYLLRNQFRPTNVATSPDGRVFVADGYGMNYIHRFDRKGDYFGSFGITGRGEGELSCPHGLMVDTRGAQPKLVVADRGNRRLQYFDLEGRHLGFVKDELRAPCHFDERDGVLLIPDLESRVTLFDRQNKLIAHLGDGGHYNGIRDKAREAFEEGKFIAPHGACFDASGNIFVVEWVEVGRITKLRRVS